MANDERNLETIPTGALGLIPLASCTEDVYKRQGNDHIWFMASL